MHPPRDYETRIDQFRSRAAIGRVEWAVAADVGRAQLNKYRAGIAEPRAPALAQLVGAASRILGRRVAASELFDLGEDEPLGDRAERKAHIRGGFKYDSRLDRLLRRIGIESAELARKAGVWRIQIVSVRGGVAPRVRTIRRIVVALRRMGYDVKARDVADVGED